MRRLMTSDLGLRLIADVFAGISAALCMEAWIEYMTTRQSRPTT